MFLRRGYVVAGTGSGSWHPARGSCGNSLLCVFAVRLRSQCCISSPPSSGLEPSFDLLPLSLRPLGRGLLAQSWVFSTAGFSHGGMRSHHLEPGALTSLGLPPAQRDIIRPHQELELGVETKERTWVGGVALCPLVDSTVVPIEYWRAEIYPISPGYYKRSWCPCSSGLSNPSLKPLEDFAFVSP